MKTVLLSAFALAIAAAPVFGEDQDEQKQPKHRNYPPPQRQVNSVPKSYTPPVQQKVRPNTPPVLPNKPYVNTRTYTPKTNPQNFQRQPRTFTPDQSATMNPNGKWNTQNWSRNRDRTNTNVVNNQTPTATVPPNTTTRNRDWQDQTNWNRNWQNNSNSTARNRDWQNQSNRNRDWQNQANTNRNWQNQNRNRWNTFTYQQAQSRFHRHHHNRSWWRSHYPRIALFAGGYYYWNDGYWYPAYGYDPYYSRYAYDEPIYGYNDLDPGQVIVNVQSALQEQGYYNDEVDGLIGPNTRAALSRFQRDHGLPVTAAIDGPTLEALGLY